jgi:hypothetical protein
MATGTIVDPTLYEREPYVDMYTMSHMFFQSRGPSGVPFFRLHFSELVDWLPLGLQRTWYINRAVHSLLAPLHVTVNRGPVQTMELITSRRILQRMMSAAFPQFSLT